MVMVFWILNGLNFSEDKSRTIVHVVCLVTLYQSQLTTPFSLNKGWRLILEVLVIIRQLKSQQTKAKGCRGQISRSAENRQLLHFIQLLHLCNCTSWHVNPPNYNLKVFLCKSGDAAITDVISFDLCHASNFGLLCFGAEPIDLAEYLSVTRSLWGIVTIRSWRIQVNKIIETTEIEWSMFFTREWC